MATEDRESPEDTRKKMMMWADFTAKVASGEIKGDAKIGDLGKDMDEFKKLFEQQKDQDIKQLFGINDDKGDVQQRAAGSLLHMIQDSYASGHAEREDLGDYRKGSIISFHSYANQDHDKHGHDDEMGEGKTLEEQLKNTPGARDAVEQSTAVLKLLKEGKSSAEITQYLDKEVFALHDPAKEAGPGEDYQKGPPSLWDKVKKGAGDIWDVTTDKASGAWRWLTGAPEPGDYPLPPDDQRYA